MNFLARSSRVTGPKMRVPIGSSCLLISTAALRSKRMALPSGRRSANDGAHDDGAVHLALLHAAARDRLLDRDDDDIADAGILAARAAQHLDALDPTGAGIVGDLEIGPHLNHDCSLRSG